MNLTEFKAQNGIEKLNFYKSKQSNRMVASHGNISIVTTEDFDPKKEQMVYDNPASVDTEIKSFVLSNTVPRDADMVL